MPGKQHKVKGGIADNHHGNQPRNHHNGYHEGYHEGYHGNQPGITLE